MGLWVWVGTTEPERQRREEGEERRGEERRGEEKKRERS